MVKNPDQPDRNLRDGLQLSREEFHFRYQHAGDGYRAELIDGVVREPSPLGYWHGKNHALMTLILGTYARRTPGTDALDNASVFLSRNDEVQPDLILRIASGTGHSKITEDGYIQGAPELLLEISDTSKSLDLGEKKSRYTKFGVREYIVLCSRPTQLHIFDLQSERQVVGGVDGVFRSKTFVGLWIHMEAVLKDDYATLIDVLEQGLVSPEHTEFVDLLNA